MKVKIHSADFHLTLGLPTAMMLNGLTARIAAHSINEEQHGTRFTPEQMNRLFREIKAVRRDFPDWVLVDVETADGEIVKVTI